MISKPTRGGLAALILGLVVAFLIAARARSRRGARAASSRVTSQVRRLIVDAEGSCFPTLLHSLCVRSRA